MPKKKTKPSKALALKRQLQATSRELTRLRELQWVYSKRLLKFGMAAWIFGLSAFFSAIIMMDARALGITYNVWIPLMIIALAAPVLITVAMIRKFSSKIKYLERVRHRLLGEYEKAILKRVEKMITEG